MEKNNPYLQYQQIKINSSTKEDLIIMAYDGAIKFLNLSLEYFKENNPERINYYIKKTQAIINELMNSLNFELGGDIAMNLFRLYEYMNYRLVLANIKKDLKQVVEIIGLLSELKSGWIAAKGKVFLDARASISR